MLELTVRNIDNPTQQAIAISVQLEVMIDTGSRSVDLGLATPFPPDQPGVFLLALPDAARTALAAGRTALASLRVVTISAAEPLQPRVAVVVGVRLLAQPLP